MKKKIINLSKNDLETIIKESVTRILDESRKGEQMQYREHTIRIETFFMDDESDREYIAKNADAIWNILILGYEKIGGFKGFQTKKDLLKKSSMIKLGFYDDEIVAVDVFNGYLGGNKSVGITCVKDDRHEAGVLLVEMIIRENINNVGDWVWCEASGRVEDIYKKYNGLLVSDKYLPIFLVKRFQIVGDGFHYYHEFPEDNYAVLSETDRQLRIKCIFGVKDRETYEIMIEDEYGPLIDFINRLKSNTLNEETVYDRYFAKKNIFEQSKMIIDRFIEMVENENVYEFPPQLIQEFHERLVFLSNSLKNGSCPENIRRYVAECVENGYKAFSKISELKPITIGVK